MCYHNNPFREANGPGGRLSPRPHPAGGRRRARRPLSVPPFCRPPATSGSVSRLPRRRRGVRALGGPLPRLADPRGPRQPGRAQLARAEPPGTHTTEREVPCYPEPQNQLLENLLFPHSSRHRLARETGVPQKMPVVRGDLRKPFSWGLEGVLEVAHASPRKVSFKSHAQPRAPELPLNFPHFRAHGI